MIQDFEAKLNEYAHLLVEVGMNVQPGQTPSIDSSIEYADLTRKCVSACYDCGARNVLVNYVDDFVTRENFLRADEAVFSEYPSYLKARFDWLLERKSPCLSLAGSDPELLKGVDPARIQARRKASGPPTRAYFDALTANKFQWCVGSYPTLAWAEKAFPGQKGEDALDALWDAIFSVCRITGDGRAVERWKDHVAATARRAKVLNDYQFASLRYANSLGTDLTIRLPENHVWAGGSDFTPEGVEFVANIPTEEIFTAPRWDGVDGRVYAALPLALDGNLVKDFYMDFKDGRIVDVHAGEGGEILRRSIDTDEGAHYLGEVALVPYDSPIRSTGILFYETLFDENASCHLAFGEAYPSCVKGGEDMSEEEQKAAGLNRSDTHVDFMVGTRDLSIVGTTHDGKEIPVFINGNFAF
ncbi:MAG: aminopeptidase [Oscillospiraceae bacterium]|nr:aminopeptidase [Oscillospiraceae bacterium]